MAKKEKIYDIVVKVEKNGSRMVANEVNSGEAVADRIPYGARKAAYEKGLFLGRCNSKAGNTFWKRLESIPSNYSVATTVPGEYKNLTDDEIRSAIQESYDRKPKTLILPELQWKLAVRALMRGENIIFTGHSGGGKTLTARMLSEVYHRPLFKFNMGSMQDAKTSLIGNTHYSPEKGTFFAQSEFITAITTPHAVVLLDEATRMSNDAENILMTVLDDDQRYIRIDENPDLPVIHVAEGVVFFATANVGTEYTSTRIIDRATKDRFTTLVEIPLLTEQQEFDLLKLLYPQVNKDLLKGVAAVAAWTREEVASEEPEISTIVSTRSTVEQVALLIDGFKFSEVMEAIVIPIYDAEGGVDSERAKIKQVIQGKSHLDNVPVFPLTEKKKEVETIDMVEVDDTDPENIFDPAVDALDN